MTLTAVLETLSSIWAGVKAWRAKKAAAELQPGQEIVDVMKRDRDEIDDLAAGAEAKP